MAFDRMIMRANTFGQPYALTDAATIATDASLAQRFTVSIAVARALGVPTNPVDGDLRIWEIKNTSGSPVNLTLPTTTGGWVPMETVEGTPVPVGPAVNPIPAGEVLVLVCYYSTSQLGWIPISTLASI
jgi:hypothetical protein